MVVEKKITLMGDRVEVYKDFSINLLNCIYDFYLDKSSLDNAVDVRNHFNWCFTKVNNEFKKEDIDFDDNKLLKDYIYSYYEPNFYNNQDFYCKEDVEFKPYLEFWNGIFNTDNLQGNLDITKILVELYLLFDETIENKKKEKNTCIIE